MSKIRRSVQEIYAERQRGEPSNLDELRRLIAAGASLDDQDEYGWTAFMGAVYDGLDDVAELLKNAGADSSRYGDVLLFRAITQDDDADLARKAFMHGANPNCQFMTGCSALWLVTFHGCAKIVEILVQAGAQVPLDALLPLGEMDITDWKIDPIELEVHYARVAEILLKHGASPHVTAHNGQPLITTFPERSYPSIHRVLAEAISRQIPHSQKSP
jgi:ankyrin repeat protein